MLGRLAAPLVRAYCTPRAAAFARALDDVARTQREVLRDIVRHGAATEYAQSLGLRADDDVDAFRAKVPVVTFEDLAALLERQRQNGGSIVTPGRVRCHEPTSGSSGAIKRIPYNDALLRSFRGMFAVWAHDLLTHALHPRSGRTFMSVSPRFGARGGFDDDSEYLGPALRALLGRFLVAPRAAREARTPDAFRDALAGALLACNDLEIVSVWSPSYLLALLEHIETHRERLLPLLARTRRRALECDPIDWTAVWPRLQLVSCWTAGAAAAPARRLAGLLPHAHQQGKGLLATEGPLTIPLVAAHGCVPLIDEVFIELEDASGRLCLLDEVEQDHAYAVVLTQKGGLLRYRLGDLVRVAGRYRDAPLLEFLRRTEATVDLVGEKLHEDVVAQALQQVLRKDAFGLLLPVASEGARAFYCLLSDDQRADVGELLDMHLRRIMRYGEARALEQLDAIRVLARPDMRRAVHDALVADGMQAGDIKDRALLTTTDRAQRLYARLAR